MFIISKIISDGENNFTQNKYNKLQKISVFLIIFFLMLIYHYPFIKMKKSPPPRTLPGCKNVNIHHRKKMKIVWNLILEWVLLVIF